MSNISLKNLKERIKRKLIWLLIANKVLKMNNKLIIRRKKLKLIE